jgi:hypothetical protein
MAESSDAFLIDQAYQDAIRSEFACLMTHVLGKRIRSDSPEPADLFKSGVLLARETRDTALGVLQSLDGDKSEPDSSKHSDWSEQPEDC